MTTNDNQKPFLLSFADYHDNILREPIAPVSFPLSDDVKQTIRNMIYSIQSEQLEEAGAPFKNAAGMAANQWGIKQRIFLYCPEGDTKNHLEVIINPSYVPITDPHTTSFSELNSWEGCFSIPLAAGNIKRYLRIKAHYQNENGEHLSKELDGWHARVWQHENDHLDGHLYDDPRTGKCSQKIQFNTIDELEDFYTQQKED